MANNQKENEKFKVWWDEKEGVMRILATSDQTEEIAKKMVAEERRLTTELNKRGINVINILCDVAKARTATSKARKIFVEWIKEGKVNKYALCGAEAFQRITANFVFAFADFKNVKLFKTEEEALRWLREE